MTDLNYKALVSLDNEFQAQGLKILAVPSKQFMDQEYSCEADVEAFARRQGAKF
jgi:glutathione peroxidase